jgi:hypothetical protein
MKRPPLSPGQWPISLPLLAAVLCVVVPGFGLLSQGCAPNDPFDPTSSPNEAPTVRIFVAPLDPSVELSPTSYNERTFYWSGNDQDGWITEFHLSIRTDRDVAEPWITTQRTDTTMTFVTDEFGKAEATFYLVCQDNRGALSDTLIQQIPLKNFPPVINFEADFNALYNLQREITAESDTLYWNWGVNNFRFFAYDPDGSSSMDPFFRYTLSDGEPAITRDVDDILADPDNEWVRVPFASLDEDVHRFELSFKEIGPGDPRRLTISLVDEAFADTRFVYEWIVREPKGAPGSRVLFVQEGAGVPDVFTAALNETYGVDGWDVYRFWAQFPDEPVTLIETFRQFDLVIWGNNGNASPNFEKVTDKDAAILSRYVNGSAISGPRKLMVFSPTLSGDASTLAPAFQLGVLGVTADGDPRSVLFVPAGRQALGLEPHLGAMTAESIYGGLKACGLAPVDDVAEAIYRLEDCPRCYGGRAPDEPIVGVRRPLRASGEAAQVIGLSFTPDYFYDSDNPNDPASEETVAALRAILEQELEVSPQ